MSVGNPQWKTGGISPNPEGRKIAAKRYRFSSRTPEGQVERFMAEVTTIRQLKKEFKDHDVVGKLKMREVIWKYFPPFSLKDLNGETVDALYKRITEQPIIHINGKGQEKEN